MRRLLATLLLCSAFLLGRASSEAPRRLIVPSLVAQLFSGVPVDASYIPTPFKTLQTFLVNIANVTSATATLSPAVNTAATVLTFGGWDTSENSGFINGGGLAWLELTNTTTVTGRKAVGGGVVNIRGTAIEFLPQMIKSAQCGSISVPVAASTGSTVITSVSTAKAWVFFTGFTNDYNVAAGVTQTITYPFLSLQDATHVQATIGTINNTFNTTVGFCVAEGR